MLPKDKFIAGMTLLSKAFLGWQFNINDDEQIAVWYMALKGLSEEAFNNVIGEYLAHNINPPRSPRELTSVIVDRIVADEKIKPEAALNAVRDIVSNCGGWDYGGRAEIYQELKKHPALYDTVHEFEAELRRMNIDDTYTADRFRKAYEVKLRTRAIKQVDTALGLKVTDNSNLLGAGFLPSEI